MFVPCSQFGYQHITVNHSKNFKDPTTGACTNTCEGGWAHSKWDMVPGTRKKEHFSAHLAVQMLRKRLKAAEAAGGHDIVVGFFKEANKYMSNRALEFEYLDSVITNDRPCRNTFWHFILKCGRAYIVVDDGKVYMDTPPISIEALSSLL